MPRLLTVFIDGLRCDALREMPFMSSLPFQRPLRPDLGYSIACHASIYTGVRPDRHLQWFVWVRRAESSPFRWLAYPLRLPIPDHLLTRVAVHRLTRLLVRNSSFFGIPLMANLPLREWPHYDVVEKKLWCEPGYMERYPTFFDIARAHEFNFESYGMDRRAAGRESVLVDRATISTGAEWVTLFFGDVDHASHRYGQFSDHGRAALRRVDEVVAKKYRDLTRYGDVRLLCFSDHGHTLVERRVDPEALLRAHGLRLRDHQVLVEANYLRFWVRSERERLGVERALSEIAGGKLLSDEDLRHYRVGMPDNRYGDLIYYLDQPAVFSPTLWGFGRTLISAHGYLPEHESSLGVVASTHALRATPAPHVVDIAPTVLEGLGIAAPTYMDGRSLWETAA